MFVISHRDIDPDAIRVLTRLHQNDFTAYLVGGSVRDLLLGRRPKDFDIGTDAHPYEIKKLFRNCWIIGRRFRLAHIKFGAKTIEVATFRKNVGDLLAPPPEESADPVVVHSDEKPRHRAHADEHGIVRRDNVYGTPEEDAFRRDFTVNALFYDVPTDRVIDYTGGLEDLRNRRIVSIGDPVVRFTEDPVRMLRAAVFAARLDFDLDEAVLTAIETQGGLIQKASPARMLEEYFKILRSGYAEATFRMLDRVGLLQRMTPELHDAPHELWASLARLDAWRRGHDELPATLVNPVLLGALLVPLGRVSPHQERLDLGMLTLARKDVERLRHLLMTAPKLTEPDLPPRVARGLPGRPSFGDALAWLDVFGSAPEAVAHWRQVQAEHKPEAGSHRGHGGHPGHRARHDGHARRDGHAKDAPHASPPDGAHDETAADAPAGRRRRRRRGRRRRKGGGSTPAAG